jgi:hypothetical protein
MYAIKKVYCHDPGDSINSLAPEIMEDVVKWIFLAVNGMTNANSPVD